jgi:hypothetical protein
MPAPSPAATPPAPGCARVENVFAAEKCRLGLLVRTVGLVRARVKISLANLAYNLIRLAWRSRVEPRRFEPTTSQRR